MRRIRRLMQSDAPSLALYNSFGRNRSGRVTAASTTTAAPTTRAATTTTTTPLPATAAALRYQEYHSDEEDEEDYDAVEDEDENEIDGGSAANNDGNWTQFKEGDLRLVGGRTEYEVRKERNNNALISSTEVRQRNVRICGNVTPAVFLNRFLSCI